VIDACSGAREAYEHMRRQVVAALPGSGLLGAVVLLREGVAAWIERCAVEASSRSFTPASESSAPIPTPPLYAGLIQILASIALNRT
jgi:hypothetical protein